MKISEETKSIKRLSKYCKKEFGFDVVVDNNIGNEISFSEKKISICRAQKDWVQLYSLVHEIGHIILCNNKNYKKIYNMRINTKLTEKEEKIIHKKASRNLIYRVNILREELDAWSEGYKLAKKKRIRIDNKKWNDLRSMCIRNYARFVDNPKYAY